MNREIIGQPIEIATGPPLFQACAKVVKHPAKIEIIEKEIAKFFKTRPGSVEFLFIAKFC